MADHLVDDFRYFYARRVTNEAYLRAARSIGKDILRYYNTSFIPDDVHLALEEMELC